MDADSALRLLGPYSRWQMQRYIAYGIGFGIPFSWMVMSAVFIGDSPDHRCALPSNASLNDSIPRVQDEDGTWRWSQCSMFVVGDNETQACTHGYWYDPQSGYESTLVTEFDLVCEHHWLFELSMSINALGSGLGSLVFPRLSDFYGRKIVFLGCLWSNVLVAVVMAFSPNYIFYSVFALIDGFQQQGMLSAAVVLALEIFPTEGRTFAGFAIEFFWAFGYMLLAPMAYFIRNWRHLQLAISLPMLLSFSFYWFISESIPWLVANQRYDEAQKIMEQAAKTNGIAVPDNIFTDPTLMTRTDETTTNGQDEEKELTTWKEKDDADNMTTKKKDDDDEVLKRKIKSTSYGVLDIFRSPPLRLYSFVLFLTWFVNSITYYSLNYTVTYLPGNRYLNFFLYALMEVPAYAIMWYLIHRFGRRIPMSIFEIIAGVSLVCNVVAYFEFSVDLTAFIIVVNIIGKFAITGSFATVYVNTPEIYPTNVRNIGMGMCMTVARVASYLSPYSRTLHRSLSWLPPVIVGSLSVVAGGCALLLPETRHTKLPDTIDEVEQWRKTNRHNRRSGTMAQN